MAPKVVFTDEWGGGLGARCPRERSQQLGTDAIFHLKDNKLSMAVIQAAAAQGDSENCCRAQRLARPSPGRDIEVQPGTRAAFPS